MLLILIIASIGSSILEFAEFAYILQFADYRYDRLKDYLTNREGLKKLAKFHWLWRAVTIFLFSTGFLTLQLAILAVFILDILYRIYKILIKKQALPSITIRSILTIFIPMSIEALFLYFYSQKLLYVGLIIILWRPLLILLTSLLLEPIFELIKFGYIKMATKKMEKYTKLIRIGITGSYGKTTVKTFLTQMLSQKFKVISTPKNINTEIGIAKFILQNDFEQFDIFVSEMGAYGRGEIQTMCKMVKPKIGILTTIIEQHLALFKTIQNIQLAKYELLYAIPQDGLAITNSDNKYCREFLPKLNSIVKTFGSENIYKPTCLIKKTKQERTKLLTTFEIEGEQWDIEAHLLGEHQSFNLAPCVIAGQFCGMSKSEIIDAITKLKVPERTLKIFKYGTSLIIDDSYNANPEGFIASLKILNLFNSKYKKIVIAKGMFELGKLTAEKHKEVGEKISDYAQELVITTEEPANYFKNGVNTEKTNILSILDSQKLDEYITKLKTEKSIILIENKLPDIVYTKLLKELTEFKNESVFF